MVELASKIKITFPDGTKKEYKKGVTGEEIAKGISEGLLRKAVAVKINDELRDTYLPINESCEFKVLTFNDEEGKDVFWHSTSHLMAQAILRVFPESKLTIGPVVENGFYYDIDHPPFKEEDLEKIEEEMKKIVKEDLQVRRKEISVAEAKKLFKDNKYKVEMLNDIDKFEDEGSTGKKGIVSVYKQGEFTDLCRGPHLPRTGMIKAFKLTKIAGAYWRGDAKNKQLQRIYGVSYPDKKQLKEYLEMLEEAEKRDHRKIGKEMDLFMVHEVSPGSPFFYHKGTVIFSELQEFIRAEYRKRGYEEVITPLLYEKTLWETSGHWEHFKEDMFTIKIDDREFSLKPMNCPGHVLMYKSRTKSYRDLPWRIADFAPLHRNELRGVLSGLTRVRKFSQDDAHIFVTEEQLEPEILELLDFVKYVYGDVFGFNYRVVLSTRPEKAMGDIELWNKAELALETALNNKNIAFEVNEGDGAFYGPKIDIMIEDALKREWQCATIQLDFQMPLRFNATYEGEDGRKHTPIMIHRAILGSLERFIGVLIEHYAGKFPLWLSPVQVKVLTIADRHETYADRVVETLKKKGLRVEKDYRSETMNKKVRDAQLEKVNYIVVVGDKEAEKVTVNVRTRDGVVHGEKKLEKFAEELSLEANSKK